MQHGAAPIKAALGYQLRHSGTEGAEDLYRQPRLLPPIRLFRQFSQKAAFKTACKANRLSNLRASILIRLSGLLTAFAVNSLPLCQLTELPQIQTSFRTGSIEKTTIFSPFSLFFRAGLKQNGWQPHI
ncbi:MAG: hypothetical protein LBG27_05445 [Spirochaetaceae bacterium]|jgi:hypothetical protein|nr:hypothetical protein [Spirochaetaceae bacterium]